MQFHVRRVDGGAGFLPVGGQRGERDGIGPLRVILLAQDGGQEGVGEGDQRSVGAESEIERDMSPTGSDHVGLDTAEDGHVRPAKSVNGLLAVADDEERTQRCVLRIAYLVLRKATERVDDLLLATVGVLELVYQDGADFGLPAGADFVVAREERQSPCLQVVKVEGAAIVLEVVVLCQGTVEEVAQAEEGVGALLVQGPGKRSLLVHQGSECGVEVGAEVLHRLPRRSQSTGVPVTFSAARGDGPAQGQESGEEDIPFAGLQRGVGFGPAGQNLLAGGLQFVVGLVGLEAGQLVQRGSPGRLLQPLVEPARQRVGPAGQGDFELSRAVGFEGGDCIQPLLHQRGEGLAQLVLGHVLEQEDHFRNRGSPGQGSLDGAGLQQSGVGFVQDVEVGVYLGLGGVGAEDFGAEGVDGADAGPVQGGEGLLPVSPLRRVVALLQPLLDRGADADAHLTGRFLGEGDGDDGAEGEAGFQQGQVTSDQGAGLAGAGAGGDDCKRSGGLIGGLDGVGLLVGELVEGKDGWHRRWSKLLTGPTVLGVILLCTHGLSLLCQFLLQPEVHQRLNIHTAQMRLFLH